MQTIKTPERNLKKTIKKAKASFLGKALSDKQPAKVWILWIEYYIINMIA